LRDDYMVKGETATTRRVQNVGGIPTKEQFQLFPKKPGRKMSYIAGLPKPKGCV
jgi:tRNA 2-thiouridine synthesizing protein E